MGDKKMVKMGIHPNIRNYLRKVVEEHLTEDWTYEDVENMVVTILISEKVAKQYPEAKDITDGFGLVLKHTDEWGQEDYT